MNTVIRSDKNPLYRDLLALLRSKGLREQKRAILSGIKVTQEICRETSLGQFWVLEENMPLPSPTTSGGSLPGKSLVLSSELFKTLDVLGSHNPLLVIQQPEVRDWNQVDPDQAALYVGLGDPHNLGAVLRSCVAFAWPQVVLLKEAAHPFLPKALKASSGAALKLSLFTGPSITELDRPNLYALDLKGAPLPTSQLKRNLHFLVGEEGPGIPQNFRGGRLSIPIAKECESLNAVVATSLLLYEWRKQNP